MLREYYLVCKDERKGIPLYRKAISASGNYVLDVLETVNVRDSNKVKPETTKSSLSTRNYENQIQLKMHVF